MSLDQKIQEFVEHLNAVTSAYYQKNYQNLNPPTFVPIVSNKWCKICRKDFGGVGMSAHSFIALSSFETKTLGKINEGDIHKAASWKLPAKHARGNVFKDNFGSCLTPEGYVHYIR